MNNNQQQPPQWKTSDQVQATLLYTHVRRDAISLANTKVVVASSGKILANTQKSKRINVVKELIDTWYTLSHTLINTASVGRLKPEFCQALYHLIDAGTKKFQERSFTKSNDQSQRIEPKTQQQTNADQKVVSADFLEQLLQKVEDQTNDFVQAKSVKIAPINVQSPILNNSLLSTSSCSPIYTESQRVQLAELTLENKKLALTMKRIRMKSFESESELKLAKLQNEINALKAKSMHDMLKAKETHISTLTSEMKLTENLTQASKAQKLLEQNRVVYKTQAIYDEDYDGRKTLVGHEEVECKADIDLEQETLNHKKIKLLKQLERESSMPIIFEENYQQSRQTDQLSDYNQEGNCLPLPQSIEVGTVLALQDNELDNFDSRSFQSKSEYSQSNYNTKEKKYNKKKQSYGANSMKSSRTKKSSNSYVDEDGFCGY